MGYFQSEPEIALSEFSEKAFSLEISCQFFMSLSGILYSKATVWGVCICHFFALSCAATHLVCVVIEIQEHWINLSGI